ncbi:MAG: Mbeg1-like protein [Lachnospiraceae bacterium]|nr:Mbeg1-like protein [Lachnospiraceae bacterium]
MGNIVDYIIEYGDKGFDEVPFNEVDGLVLSQFVYLKWENVIPKLTDDKDGITLTDMQEKMQEAEVFSYEAYRADNMKLWNAMVNSKRFGEMKCNYLSEMLDPVSETQFLAFAVFPKNALPVVLFRGTDETILGWKEDYNMAFTMPVTGQRMAKLYLGQVALRIEGDFYVAGHSKGGNLSIYAGLSSDKHVQDRIAGIYNYDGPHMRPEVVKDFDENAVYDRHHKYIPYDSFFGIMLETKHHYTICDSTANRGVFQHYPYTWKVEGTHFVYKKKLTKRSLRLNERVSEAFMTLTNEQIVFVSDLLFGAFARDDVETTSSLQRELKKTAQNAIQEMGSLSAEQKKQLFEVVKEFM